MTATVSRSYTILDTEFDVDQLKDIVNHGMSAGVPGFIYTSACVQEFDDHEDEIEEYLSDWYHDNLGEDNYLHAMTANRPELCSIDALKTHMVWSYVELKADEILAHNGYEYWSLH